MVCYLNYFTTFDSVNNLHLTNCSALENQSLAILELYLGTQNLTTCLLQVPVNLLRAGRIFVFEPPPGVKANMLRTFSSIPVARMCKVKTEFK